MNPGESPLETARRELSEELGITDITVLSGEPLESRYEVTRGGHTNTKSVTLFVGLAPSIDAHAQPEELQGYRWVTPAEAKSLLYPNERHLIDAALNRLRS